MEIIFLFIGFGAIVLLIRFLLQKFKIILPKKYFMALLIAHLFFIFLFVVAMILSQYNIYFRGYRSHSFIFIGTCISGVLLYWFSADLSILEKILFTGLTFSGTTTLFILSVEIYYDYKPQLFFDSEKYRLEETGRSLMSPAILPNLFIKNGLFEREYLIDKNYGIFISFHKLDSVKIFELQKDSVEIVFYHRDTARLDIKNPLIRKVKIE